MLRRLLPTAAVTLLVVACTDQGVGPTDPLQNAPTVQMSHFDDWMQGDPTTGDLCGGLSPCDGFDYDQDGDGDPSTGTGVPGLCFLPPTVDNHLSDPACSGDFVPGLDGAFKLAWCKVNYLDDPDGNPNGELPPTIDYCQPRGQWKDLVQDPNGGEFYATSVRWRRNGQNSAAAGDIFRLYVVRDDLHYAHRDVIVDPNLTTPADGFVHAIGYGNEPVKVRITESFSCVYFDTQDDTLENAATCLIAGFTSIPFQTNEVTTAFTFPDGNPTFFADFEVSECLSLHFDPDGPDTGHALVDVPLAGCKISLTSEELQELDFPGRIDVDLADLPFGPDARPNVLQYDAGGVGALPPSSSLPPPSWLGTASDESGVLGWLNWGVDKLRDVASFFGPQPVYAWPGSGWDFTRLSDFQVAWMPVMAHGNSGSDCASLLDSCLHLGTFSTTNAVEVEVHVTAPSASATPTSLLVPGTRLHVVPESGSVACPANPAPGQACVPAGDPDDSTSPSSTWDQLVVITGSDGRAVVDWSLDGGDNRLLVSACGVARPGAVEPNSPTGGVWGALIPVDDPNAVGCYEDRQAAMNDGDAFDNGPADGLTPFEPAKDDDDDSFGYETAIYGLPLVFEASTCPQITVDGMKGSGEWVEGCATPTSFRAPLKGSKKGPDNAVLYTYNDGEALYIALEVETNDLGNKIFINLVEEFPGGAPAAAAGDDLLLIDFGDPSDPLVGDWHYTQHCVENSSSSLCGDPDDGEEVAPYDVAAAADANGAGTGSGHAFYEFRRPFDSPHSMPVGLLVKEDLAAGPGDPLALLLTVTQGQGGGKGGFVYPDPQGPGGYHEFTLND